MNVVKISKYNLIICLFDVSYAIKITYAQSLIDMLPNKIELPSSLELKSLSLIEQIKALSKFVVLIKVK